MNPDFTKSMQRATDEELVSILTTDRDEYQEAAIEAAEIELAVRNLSSDVISFAREKSKADKAIKTTKAEAPLDDHWKVLSFFFPGILQLIISGMLVGQGYDRKARELSRWTVIGLCAYVLLFIFIGAFEE
jgi:hypothetical protein